MAVLLLKFPLSPSGRCCAVEVCFSLTAGALLTTHGDLSRGIVSNETSASPTPKWPSHHPAAWSVLRIWQEKQREAAASCPVRSRTDASSTRAVNDIFGPRPPCDDGGSDQSSLQLLAVRQAMLSKCGRPVNTPRPISQYLQTLDLIRWCSEFIFFVNKTVKLPIHCLNRL